MNMNKELTQLYKDAMYYHLIKFGYTKRLSKTVVNKTFKSMNGYQLF